jgi:hypothetical protein
LKVIERFFRLTILTLGDRFYTHKLPHVAKPAVKIKKKGLKKERISSKNYIFLKFYAISESRKLEKYVEADDTILRRKN